MDPKFQKNKTAWASLVSLVTSDWIRIPSYPPVRQPHPDEPSIAMTTGAPRIIPLDEGWEKEIKEKVRRKGSGRPAGRTKAIGRMGVTPPH
jgi:hypothetical protein